MHIQAYLGIVFRYLYAVIFFLIQFEGHKFISFKLFSVTLLNKVFNTYYLICSVVLTSSFLCER